MPRKTATYVTCDGPTCKHMAEVIDANEAPDGWYRILPEKDGKYMAQEAWEFHSLICVAKWAKGRKSVLEGKHIPGYSRTSPSNDDLGEIATKQTAEILEAFKMEPGVDYTITEIVDLTGVEKSSAKRRIEALIEDGEVIMTTERRGPFGARYKFAS